MFVVVSCSWPSQSAMTVISTPAWSNRIAAVWRLCGIPHKRHTCAMTLLHAGIDTASIALWLGHANIQTTQVYLHADLELKRRTLERLPALDDRPPARYRASDALIAFLANR